VLSLVSIPKYQCFKEIAAPSCR